MWPEWAAEIGIGYLGSGKNRLDQSTVKIGGDLDVKYLFFTGTFRPFVQGGMYWDFASNLNDNEFVFGNKFFAGVGLFLVTPGFYVYASYNTGPPGMFPQAGLGMDL